MTTTEIEEVQDGRNSIYVYNGVDEVPLTVTHLRVDPSVTEIPPRAFLECVTLTQVELPEGLEKIGFAAFSCCRALKTIHIPSTVHEIGGGAFVFCSELKEIILPQGLVKLGERAFHECRSLETLYLPPMIQTIERFTFLECTRLTKVILPTNLQEIKEYAFYMCESLVSIEFPSSLRVIGRLAFQDTGLTVFNLPDTVEDWGYFCGCKLPNFRMPLLITKFDPSNFGAADENHIVSIELPETLKQVTYSKNIHSLLLESRIIAFPAECSIDMGDNVDDEEKTNHIDFVSQLQHRFDGLPVHKICYYHSYHDAAKNMRDIQRVIHPWSTKTRCGKLSEVGKRQDFQGMTPLHILVSSTKHRLEMYQMLVEKYPDNLVTKDKWGEIPLTYAFCCNAPSEIIDFLMESYKLNHPHFKFDWEHMVSRMAIMSAPLKRIQTLLDARERSFPDDKCNLHKVVVRLAYDNTDIRDESFQFLVHTNIARRLNLLNVRRWRDMLEAQIKQLSISHERVVWKLYLLHDLLVKFEYRKEVTSLLELAIWRAKMTDRFHKKARVGNKVSIRNQCRMKCGVEIVIQNVLPFLWSSNDPDDHDSDSDSSEYYY